MKEHMQTVINVCLAVFITAFIYQNNSLKDDVETLKGYAQLDTDKTWDRLNKIDIDLEDLRNELDSNLTFTLGISNSTFANEEDIKILFTNFDKAKENDNLLLENIKILDRNIEDINKRLEVVKDYLLTL